MTEICVVLAIIILASIMNNRAKSRNWKYRPYRLCMNCFVVGQPLLRGNNEMYCSSCQRVDPVPLESPAAIEYFRARDLVVPEHLHPPKPTIVQTRWNIAGALALIVGMGCFGALLDHAWHSRDAAASAEPTATAAKVIYSTDEYAALTKACGDPLTSKDKDASAYGGAGGVQRDAKYRRVEFFFLRNHDSPVWTLTGTFLVHEDDTVGRERAIKLMPCLAKVQFQLGLPNDK